MSQITLPIAVLPGHPVTGHSAAPAHPLSGEVPHTAPDIIFHLWDSATTGDLLRLLNDNMCPTWRRLCFQLDLALEPAHNIETIRALMECLP